MRVFLICLSLSCVLSARVNIVVTIPPQVTFVEAIGGQHVHVSLMVQPGNSPHTYEPKPSQMRDIAVADIYMTMGVEFENIWLDKLKTQNKNMKVADISKGIVRYPILQHKHTDHTTKLDTHIWTSPQNVQKIIKNIFNMLVVIDPTNKSYYEKNYSNYTKHIAKTHGDIISILKETPPKSRFVVFHPAWGYFARQYNLTQVPIEVQGKSPKPRAVLNLIKEAKKQKTKAIFTAPEFSTKIARQIAHELDIPVIPISPLEPGWSQNLIKFATVIGGSN